MNREFSRPKEAVTIQTVPLHSVCFQYPHSEFYIYQKNYVPVRMTMENE